MGTSCVLYPMTAYFIALPTSQIDALTDIIVRAESSASLSVEVNKKAVKEGYVPACPSPSGMGARRLLLYIFSECYKKPNNLIRIRDGSNNQLLRKLGYSFDRTAMSRHPGIINYERMLNCTFQFRDESKNKSIGLGEKILGVSRFTEKRHILFITFGDILSRMKKPSTSEGFNNFVGYYRSLGYQDDDYCVNPFFIFNTSFPVEFGRVIDSNKKSEFWNVYVFLVDVLPRVKKGSTLKLPWDKVHAIFCKRYNTLENFKFNFRKQLVDVLGIYPQAKGRVDADNQDELLLKHAPPPV